MSITSAKRYLVLVLLCRKLLRNTKFCGELFVQKSINFVRGSKRYLLMFLMKGGSLFLVLDVSHLPGNVKDK